MNLRQPVTPRMAIELVLVVVYAITLTILISTSRREARLSAQVAAVEATLKQTASSAESSVPALRANLAAAQERLAVLEARVPKDVQTDLFDRAAQDAQNSGINGFRYQRKSESQETLQAGTYRVYRYTISGRGSQDRVITFLDGLQKGSGSTMIIDNVIITAVGAEWQMSADITVYTAGA